MRLLRVIESMSPATGGPAEGIRQITPLLAAAGHGTTVLCRDATAALAGDFGGECVALGGGGRIGPWVRRESARFDAVVVHGLWQHAAAVARNSAAPWFVFPHGMLDPWFRRAYPLKHLKKQLYWLLAEHRAMAGARAVLFTSEGEREAARGTFRPYRLRERVVPYGIRPPAAGGEAARKAFLARFPDLKGKKVILFLGRLHPKKGGDLAVGAFAEALRSPGAEEFRLLLAGPDEEGERERLGLQIAALSAEARKRIVLAEALGGDLKAGAFTAADAFILPSHQENFGLAVVEALAAGTPVLISDRVNIHREIAAAGAGLVAPDDLPGTARLLREWIGRGGADAAARERARACFDRHFNIENGAAAFIEALCACGARG